MIKLEIEELENNLAENDSYKEDERMADDKAITYRQQLKRRSEEIGNLKEEELAIIVEIGEVLERGQKDQLSALRDIPKKKLLEETATVNRVLCKLKKHTITKNKELFYPGFVAVTNWLGVKINKAAERKEPMWRRRRRLQKTLKG